jgi:indole-3-glycerol phosphate synthase
MTSAGATSDLLAAIVAATRRIVEVRAETVPLAALEERAAARRPRGAAFEAALARAGRVNVIAECKRRSPSAGVLRRDYDPVALARAYEAGGAAAVSVLTEPTFFDGALEHLAAVRDAVAIPVLRKDFIVDAYQIAEARAAGADAVLLIVAALDDEGLRRLMAEASRQALAALVEVHDERELARAAAAGARVIDLGASDRILDLIPDEAIAVAESGLTSPDDVRRLHRAGYDAFLIGEALVRAPDPAETLRGFCG